MPIRALSIACVPSSIVCRRVLPACLFAALAVVLGGCGGDPSSAAFPPACPRAAILADAADLTRFRAGPVGAGSGTDLTDMVLDGRITGVAGSCSRDDPSVLDVSVAVSLEAQRGPAAGKRTAEIPYFVAVADASGILDKRAFVLRAEFPANTDRLQLSTDPVALKLPIGRTKSGADYDVLVGFQLSPEELAMNQRRGPR